MQWFRRAVMLAAALAPILCTQGTHAQRCNEPVIINEIRVRHPGGGGTDPQEYVELRGAPGLDLSCYCYIVLGPDGVVDELIRFIGESIPPSGYYLIAESTFNASLFGGSPTPETTTVLNFVNADNRTHLLVKACDGLPGVDEGVDLDQDDDGVLDAPGWTCVRDCIALVADLSGNWYCPVKRGPRPGGVHPPHVFRCRVPGTMFEPWVVGLDELPPGGGVDTPDVMNPLCPTGVVEFDGIAHAALGGAVVSVDGGTLEVTNVDLSGDDGVASLLPPSLVWRGEHQNMQDDFEIGESWTVRTIGTVDGVGEQIMASHTIMRTGDDLTTTADFPTFVQTPMVVELWLAGARVHTEMYADHQDFELVINDIEWDGDPPEKWDFMSYDHRGYAAEANGGMTAAALVWEMPMDPHVVTIEGNDILTDEFRMLVAPDGGAEVWQADRIEVVAAGVSFEALSESFDAGAMYGGFPHEAQGQAVVTRLPDRLLIDGITDSGLDGIMTRLGAASRVTGYTPRPGGWKDRTKNYLRVGGSVNDNWMPIMLELGVEFAGNDVDVTIDALPIGATSVAVHATLAGAPVGSFQDVVPIDGVVATTTETPDAFDIRLVPNGAAAGAPVSIAAGYLFPEGVPVTIIGTSDPIVVDRIDIIADSAIGPIDLMDQFEMLVQYMDQMELLDFVVEPVVDAPDCTGDLDDDGTVSTADMLILIGAWGGAGADLNDDGTTDASDLLLLLGAWGPCP